MRARTALLALALCAGCSLPLPEGVQTSKGLQGAADDTRDIQVVPPGPRPRATAAEVVQGFLGAAGSRQGGHEVARQYLTPRAGWDVSTAQVYDPASLRISIPRSVPAAGPNEVYIEASFRRLGMVDADGTYQALRPEPVTESYYVVRAGGGQWRIATPPRGLRLTPADRERAFTARRVFFLSVPDGTAPRVVPDRLLLPAGGPPTQVELTRLLAGPSRALGDSVRTGFPSGTQLQSVRRDSGGTYRVALSPQVLRANAVARQELSAQLVWTLREADPLFRRLAVSVSGQPFKVPGKDDVQDAADWQEYEPERLTPGPAYYLAGGKVRLAGSTTGPVATRSLTATTVAVTPDRSQIAVLEPGARGKLRMGDPSASTLPVVANAAGLSALSWGSGRRGLWLLDARGKVLLVRKGKPTQTVPVSPPIGRATALSISRDGTRAALVSGGRLYAGRVRSAAQGAEVVGLVQVTPALSGVTEVAWRDGSSLVVLGLLSQTFVPALVTVDGATVRPLQASGLPGRPQEVATSSLGTLVTALGRIYQLGPLGFRSTGLAGRGPTYPG
jgi:hypothetical protein